jgi:hypothetical protein
LSHPAGAYDWAQSYDEVLVEVTVPANTTRRDVVVLLQPRHLLLKVSGIEVLQGRLEGLVIPVECDWRLGELGSTGMGGLGWSSAAPAAAAARLVSESQKCWVLNPIMPSQAAIAVLDRHT